MNFGTLALIGLCGFAGPLLATSRGGAAPVVVGELLAGIVIGRTGLNAIDTTNETLVFLSNIGFAMLMFAVGMSVPLREQGLRKSLGKGAMGALIVAVIAVGAGLLVAEIGKVGHPALYVVLIASSSAAVVLPILQERGVSGPLVLAVMAQVTVADVGAMVAVPLVLAPGRAGRIVIGCVVVAVSVLAVLFAVRHLRGRREVRKLRELGQQRGWAVDLRLALIVLFGLAWITEHSGASLLIAGFGAGLLVASIGGPERLSNEVLGIGGGFFIPLFFVVLGARLDIGGLFSDPSLIALAGALVALNVLVHMAATRVLHQPLAAGLVTSAQLGVPSAIVALGLPAHVLTSPQAAAIIVAALLSIIACAIGAVGLQGTPGHPPDALT